MSLDGALGRIRGTLKFMAFAGITCALSLIHFLTVPFLRLLRLHLPAARCSSRLFRSWARWVSVVLQMGIHVDGSPPQAPFVLVTNHLGYVDVVVLASLLDCVFVANADVARWPVFGPLCRTVGTIFIDRERKRDIPRVLQRIQRTLGHGRGIVLFPEGTSTDGATVLRFKPSLLETAVRARLPVSYASLTYETPPSAPPARQSVCWWGDMTFMGHMLRLLCLPGFSARVTFGRETLEEVDRKDLASRAREAVLSQFQPVAR